ncbi:hypothetical protein [Aneurinibacillus thermoaerophilus]|uniref:hypothetical protein n=1 Tax=Aneurinibacillus thermoaerophilus TaxID=143495 RepID=UPI002E1DC006|nr:hypothetical protein [Aneurinibacillus thermoaerophilus]
MFFHGIPFRYLRLQYPVLSPRQSAGQKTAVQLSDRQHLIEQFGLEPIHLLEYWRNEYTLQDCLRACFAFGDVVLAFRELPLPIWQLSRHEVGVSALSLHRTRWIFILHPEYSEELRTMFPKVPIFALHYENGKFRSFSKRK